MNKVYVVTEGEYSEHHIVGICSTLEKAEVLKARLIMNAIEQGCVVLDTEPQIEEWPIDVSAEDISERRTPYHVDIVDMHAGALRTTAEPVDFPRDMREIRCPRLRQHEVAPEINARHFDITVLADSKEHAIKIASDIRRSVLAGDLWTMR